MSRKVLWPVLAAAIAASLTAGLAVGGSGQHNKKTFEYAIGLWGDLPYSDVQATTGVPNLIADMNDAKLAFTVHDGDLKAGNGTPGSVTPTTCTDALYQQGLDYFNSLDRPAIFTPGDNDWTDCDRPSNGFACCTSTPTLALVARAMYARRSLRRGGKRRFEAYLAYRCGIICGGPYVSAPHRSGAGASRPTSLS